MTRNNLFKVLAIISSLGILGWGATNFFGGMIIYFISYSQIIIPLILIYIISLFDTLISLLRTGFANNKVKALSHGLVILVFISIFLIESDIFKSKTILTGTLKDDQFHYTLILRENGNCENKIFGIFGFQKEYHGKYKLCGDTIVFLQKPYNNNFIPDTLLIDKNAKAIFIGKDSLGNFIHEKGWLNHFEIE